MKSIFNHMKGDNSVAHKGSEIMQYQPLKNKCNAAVIRKAWRNAPEGSLKKIMLSHADKLWNM